VNCKLIFHVYLIERFYPVVEICENSVCTEMRILQYVFADLIFFYFLRNLMCMPVSWVSSGDNSSFTETCLHPVVMPLVASVLHVDSLIITNTSIFCYAT